MRALLLLPALLACTGDGPTPAGSVDEAVHVTAHPLEYVARRIAGDAVPVVNPVPPGQDPGHWNPPREDLARYQRARVLLLSGAGYEAWTGAVSLPRSRVVDTSRALPEGSLIETDQVTHSHGLDGEHSHAGVAGLVWLDPGLLARQARSAHRSMVRAWPEHEATFDAGLAALEADLGALDERLKAALEGTVLVGADRAYAYLGEQVAGFDLDPVAPRTGPLERLATSLEARPARILLWPREPSPEVADRLQTQLGLSGVVFDPAANPAQGDYLTIMDANIERLRAALE